MSRRSGPATCRTTSCRRFRIRLPASLATANARVTTDDYPYAISDDWIDPYRIERIYRLLQSHSTWTPQQMLGRRTRSALGVRSRARPQARLRHRSFLSHSARQRFNATAPGCRPAAHMDRRDEREFARRGYRRRDTRRSMVRTARTADSRARWRITCRCDSLRSPLLLGREQHCARRHPDTHAEALAAARSRELERPADLGRRTRPCARLTPRTTSRSGSTVLSIPSRSSIRSLADADISTGCSATAIGSGAYPAGGDVTTIDAIGVSFGPSERLHRGPR